MMLREVHTSAPASRSCSLARRRTRLRLAAGLALALWSSKPAVAAAQAEPSARDNFTNRPLALLGHMSGGGPFGLLGVSVDDSLARWASLELGTGIGTPSFHFAAMARARLPLSRGTGLGLGAGPSISPHWRPLQLCLGCSQAESVQKAREQDKWSLAKFGNVELFFDARTLGGFSARVYLGVWHLFNPTPDDCFEACERIRHSSAAYFGWAFGGAW